jgi:hypothetical protein
LLRTVIGGAVVAVIAGLLAVVGDGIGITTVWPVLLAAAIGLVARSAVVPRVGAAALGAVVGFVAMALRAGLLPDVVTSRALVIVLAVALLTLVAALTKGLLPLWAGLAGYAAFAGLYEPVYADSPTTFLADAPVAVLTVLLSLGLGAIAAIAGELTGNAVHRADDGHVRAGEVA